MNSFKFALVGHKTVGGNVLRVVECQTLPQNAGLIAAFAFVHLFVLELLIN